jgi:hypothetical protein
MRQALSLLWQVFEDVVWVEAFVAQLRGRHVVPHVRGVHRVKAIQ